jgi:hypothetical protein
MERDQQSPQHHKWRTIFRPYSWWKGKKGKLYVILHRYADQGDIIQQIEMLEEGTEASKLWDYNEVFEHYKQGNLTPVSAPPY